MRKNIFFLLLSFVLLSPMALIVLSCENPNVTIDASDIMVSDVKPAVKVFLENSGSMDGFMCDGSELKDDIYNYLTCMRGSVSKMELNYINTQVIPQRVPLSQYIRNLNPLSFRNAGGNRAYTEIPNSFAKLLSAVDHNTVAIYISDCILDIPNHAAPNFLSITRTDINGAFMDKKVKMKDLSVCVYQLESSFNGTFYFPKGGSQKYNGKLPYYMILVGPRHLLSTLRKSVSDDKITHGVKNYCAFTSDFDIPATLVQGGSTHKSIDIKVAGRDGKYPFDAYVDLAETLQPEAYLSSPQNYILLNPTKLSITKVIPLKSALSYSHLMNFGLTENAFSDKVQLKNPGIPQWVHVSNDVKGNRVIANKTFGIEYILGGISDAYSNQVISNFKLNIKLK